jgi:predicted DNA-binding transcriptional regulator YafY
VQWATLWFSPEAAEWVRHEVWHPTQEATMDQEGALTLRVPYADATELAMDVLRHGEHVKVLGPPALATVVGKRLQTAARAYCEL